MSRKLIQDGEKIPLTFMVIMSEQRIEQMQGSVERVTFHSEESGFCVLRTKVKGQRDLVTVIGNSASISAGEYIECQGIWVTSHQAQSPCNT